MKKKRNDPTLFVNTISNTNQGAENQDSFDSRKREDRKNHVSYRLEDINAMLMFQKNVLVEITTPSEIIEGIVVSVENNFVKLIIDKKMRNISFENILEINVLKLN